MLTQLVNIHVVFFSREGAKPAKKEIWWVRAENLHDLSALARVYLKLGVAPLSRLLDATPTLAD